MKNSIKKRNSNIELLKIISMFMIVCSHSAQTLINIEIENPYYVNIILKTVYYWGSLGNLIFFISSAWFLLDSSSWKLSKWLYMFFEIWLVSAISAIPFFLLFRDRVPTDLFVKSFFPNLFANNWYLTCYLLFYPIHPLLNKIIKQLDKRSLFYLAFSMVIAYFIGSFVFHNVLFSTYLIVWITIYFIISYIKLYLPNYTNNIKLNLYGLVMGVIGCIVIAILTNKSLMCFRAITENQGVLYWAVINNPFLLIISLSLFNIFNK